MALIDSQKTLDVVPVVRCTVGTTVTDDYVARYKYREKADSFGRVAIFLDNTTGLFSDLSSWTS